MVSLNILKEAPEYKYAGPRCKSLGPQSAEQFLEDHFMEWLNKNIEEPELELNINGFAAYPPSFFKGFILGAASKGKKYQKVISRLTIKCEHLEVMTRIEGYIKEAKAH